MATKRDPTTLTSLPEILSCISEYQSEEDQLSLSLTELLTNRKPVLDSLQQLKSLAYDLDLVRERSQALHDRVTRTAKTAARIGQHVLVIDEEMGRVREASEHVAQTMELKTSLHSLHISIESQDWEAATRHCTRAMSVPHEVLIGPFAETVVPTASHHLLPSQMLQSSREQLLNIFTYNFQQASRSLDSATISRFFKMFPAIGWEAEGLEIYSRFIVELVRARISNGTNSAYSQHYHATTLAALLENIAMVVSQHQPVVDKYYGNGRMGRVLVYLLDECDKMIGNLIQNWEQERNVKQKLLEISNGLSTSSVTKNSYHDLPTSDPRDVDKIISEVAAIVSRWNLFTLFIADALNTNAREPLGQIVELISKEKISCDLSSTRSHQLFEHLITTYYIPFEIWYLRRIINKAHLLSDSDRTQDAATTTIPDDVFYVLKVVVKRLLSLGSVRGTKLTLEGLRDIMDNNYLNVFRKRLDDSLPANRVDKNERESRFPLILIINDLDVSGSHLQHLIDDIMEDPAMYLYFIPEQQTSIKQYVASFLTLNARIQSTLRTGLEIFYNQLLRPKMRNIIPEVFKDVAYVLDDEVYSAIDHQEYVKKRFVRAWESIVECYKESLTERNYAAIFGMAVETFLRPFEKFATSTKFNELGAIRFDRDLRSILSHLSSQATCGDVREKFVRLQQISILVNLDNEDVTEFYNSSGIPWKLSIQEATAIAGLKI